MVFLERLGARLTFSSPTNKTILDDGVRLALDESCLPAKIFLGHVYELVNRETDYIFVCRYQDFNAGEVYCTKFWGIPDICRNTFELREGCKWLELNISPSVDRITDWKGWLRVGRELTANPFRIYFAYVAAKKAQKRYEAWQLAGKQPEQALKLAREGKAPPQAPKALLPEAVSQRDEIRIALLGHSYIINDAMFGKPLFKILRRLGAEVVTVEDVDKEVTRSLGREVSPHLYWIYNREIVGAAEYYRRLGVDGLILVEAFPCGPDALSHDYTVRKLRGSTPIVRLVIDELQALAGLETRLESFVDVLRMRKPQDGGTC